MQWKLIKTNTSEPSKYVRLVRFFGMKFLENCDLGYFKDVEYKNAIKL